MSCAKCGRTLGGETRRTLAGAVHAPSCPTDLVELEDALLDWALSVTASGVARAGAPDWRRRGETARAHARASEARDRLLVQADRIAAQRAQTGTQVPSRRNGGTR